MRFAGTANNQAFEALFALTKKLMAISKRSVAELAGKATMEQTICIMVLSLSVGKWHSKVHVFYCLMKKFKSLNFYQKNFVVIFNKSR